MFLLLRSHLYELYVVRVDEARILSSKDLDRATVKKIDAGADFVYWVILLVDWGDYFFVLPSTLNILQPKVGLMLSLISCSRLAPLINSVEMKA